MAVSVDLRNANPYLSMPIKESTITGLRTPYSQAAMGGTRRKIALALDFIQQNYSVADKLTGSLISFSRSTIASYIDSTGALQTASINATRYDYDPLTLQPRGLLIEESRTNSFLNSGSPATQGVTVTAQQYTLSFYGTGSIALSGAFTGNLSGTGAFPNRVQLSFTPTAGTLTLTLTGSVTQPQLEAGAFATSYIPTAGAAVTRAADIVGIAPSNWYVAAQGTWAAEWDSFGFANAPRILADNINSILDVNSGSGVLETSNGSVVLATATVATANAIQKAAVSYSATNPRRLICLNGGAVASDNNAHGSGVSAIYLGNTDAAASTSASGTSINGHLRAVRFYNYQLTSAQLQTITT